MADLDPTAPDRYSLPGHDRDCARAMWSQARHGKMPLDQIQVQHLMSIAWRAGMHTQRELDGGEPRIHSHITDALPSGHPLAFTQVHCQICHVLVHAGNNECMQTWVETGQGDHCLACFTKQGGSCLDIEWRLSP